MISLGYDYAAYDRRLITERNAGWLTPAFYVVLDTIARLHRAGKTSPTNAHIVVESGASLATVKRAKRTGRERGLLDVAPNFEMIGNLRRQQANTYALRTPTGPVSVKPRAAQRELPIQRKDKKEAYRGGLARTTETLAAIAARRTEAIFAKKGASH